MSNPDRRELLISKGWVQGAILVTLVGFFIMGLLAYRTYTEQPPVPKRVVDQQGQVLYTGKDVSKGQQVFLHNGLMEYGSAFGHGAYLGPDFTADYLRRASNLVKESYGGAESDSAGRRTIEDFRTNRYDEESGTLTLTKPQADAFRSAGGPLQPFLLRPRHATRPASRRDHRPHRPEAAHVLLRLDRVGGRRPNRPGHNYSYTNNWPPEPRVDNKPTANVVVWSVLSLIALLGGIGLLFAAFGRWGAGSAGTAASRRRCRSARRARWR